MKVVRCQKKSTKDCFETFCKERYYDKGTSKTVTEEKAKRIRQAIKGEQDGSVTASFKHWVNRTKQFKLLSYPELELADVLCLSAKIKVNTMQTRYVNDVKRYTSVHSFVIYMYVNVMVGSFGCLFPLNAE